MNDANQLPAALAATAQDWPKLKYEGPQPDFAAAFDQPSGGSRGALGLGLAAGIAALLVGAVWFQQTNEPPQDLLTEFAVNNEANLPLAVSLNLPRRPGSELAVARPNFPAAPLMPSLPIRSGFADDGPDA